MRLSGCNLTCRWCDTPYTWDWSRFDRAEQSRTMPIAAVRDWVLARDAELVVITGGEPLAQQHRLAPLVSAVQAAGRRVEVETNGTIAPTPALVRYVERFNVSPKLRGSGVSDTARLRAGAMAALRATGKAVFKFVITGADDVAELVALQARYCLEPVWVMPEGTTEHSVLAGMRALAEPALAHGWHLSIRLHVLLWGDERGR